MTGVFDAIAASLRPAQRRALAYQGGLLGISAVPGSGKTFTLEALIADLVVRRGVDPARIGVFTYMRSSRANLAERINARLEAQGLAGRLEVFTLHSLALAVLRQFHGRLGAAEVNVIEGYEQDRLIQRLTAAWLRVHARRWEPLIPSASDATRILRSRTSFTRNFRAMCRDVIRTAKHYRLAPDALDADPETFLGWALPIYRAYQAELDRSERLDYDDLGWRALELLENDAGVRTEVQGWYNYLFEDEAQDSSPLQEALLTILSEASGNLVRVGDPNQSIMGTFTTAEPRFFRRFCRRATAITLSESSRSAPKILALANSLVDWTAHEHPLRELRTALVRQHIEPATVGATNPDDGEAAIRFVSVEGGPERETVALARLAAAAMAEHPEQTCAVLVPTNEMGAQVLAHLRTAGVATVDLLRSNPSQRELIERLHALAHLFAQPASASALADAFAALAALAGMDGERVRLATTWLSGAAPEAVLFPAGGSAVSPPPGLEAGEVRRLVGQLAEWLTVAARAPWGDTLCQIVQELKTGTTDLFLGHYVIEQLERALLDRPAADWQDVADELTAILDGQLNNLPAETLAYAPQPGTVAVTTTHRSKGLEWDEVFLAGLSAYEYPVLREDRPVGLYFLDNLDMRAEALAELRRAAGYTTAESATAQAFVDLAAEKVRLLYVGITRAKRRLTLTVASRDLFGREQRPSRLFEVLQRRAIL
jgi:DNA helicase-2/ATP-dependent DNA helicase PcrA